MVPNIQLLVLAVNLGVVPKVPGEREDGSGGVFDCLGLVGCFDGRDSLQTEFLGEHESCEGAKDCLGVRDCLDGLALMSLTAFCDIIYIDATPF